MKIVCPNCSAEYTLPDSVFGAEGKKVKCASCTTVWHAVPEPETPTEIANAIVGSVQAAVGTTDNDGMDDTQDDWADDTTIESGPVETPGTVDPANRLHRRVRLKGQRDGPSPMAAILARAVPVATPALIAAGLALLIMAVPFRNQVVTIFPDLAQLYETVGLEVNVRGITFSEVMAEQSVVAGLSVLKVEAAMENVDSQTVPVAPVRMALIGEDGSELFTWRVDPPVLSLEPGETRAIISELTAPPPNVARVAVRFLKPGERLPAQIL